MAGRFIQGIVRTDVPPMPYQKVAGSTFPTAAPGNNRLAAQFLSDEHGIVSLTHNSTTVSLTFTMYVWSDVAGWWMPVATAVAAAQFALVLLGKVEPRCPVFIAASAGLGSSNVVVGGVTQFGINPTPSA